MTAAESGAAPAPTESPAATNLSLSVTPAKRAAWQQHLTLGPGDILNLSLFETPDTIVKDVPIRPDGRISFLQAADVPAAGLTIDELRAKMDAALAGYYQNPHTLITPVAFRSKKYFVLGAVATKGVFTLDRPLTVIEALARAGGLEIGVYEEKTVEMADLSRSFVVRNGERLPVDFERLFQRGDLSQNVALEPGDYLYFASVENSQIYVLGEVSSPGVALYAPRTTVISAISERGGFSPKAFQRRVLVVRGSLNHPEAFVIDTAAILSARGPNFKLQARDIVYVSANPFVKAEDLMDTAAKAFLQSMIVTWSTLHVGPLITEPLIH